MLRNGLDDQQSQLLTNKVINTCMHLYVCMSQSVCVCVCKSKNKQEKTLTSFAPKLKYPTQIEKFGIEELSFDRSVCMTAIWYSRPLLAIPPKKQLLQEQMWCVDFKNDIAKTEGLLRVYTNGR